MLRELPLTNFISIGINLNYYSTATVLLSSLVEGKAKAAGISPDAAACWQFFLSKVRANLHVVICFSPVGPDFGTYAKRFPALVNCT